MDFKIFDLAPFRFDFGTFQIFELNIVTTAD